MPIRTLPKKVIEEESLHDIMTRTNQILKYPEIAPVQILSGVEFGTKVGVILPLWKDKQPNKKYDYISVNLSTTEGYSFIATTTMAR